MRFLQRITLLSVLVGVGLGLFAERLVSTAYAAPVQDGPGSGTYGAINVATTPTRVPTSTFVNRNAFGLTNLGPNAIYCGFDGGVTTATGYPVAANGGTFGVDTRWTTLQQNTTLWCVAASGAQSSPFNTRYLEVH